MKLVNYAYRLTFSALIATSTIAHASVFSEVQETQDPHFQGSFAKSLHTKQLFKSFYRANAFDDIVNVATGKVLTEKAPTPQVFAGKVSPLQPAPLQCPHVYLVEELETLRIPQAMAAVFSQKSDKLEAQKIMDQFDVKWGKYKLGEKDPALPRSAAVNRSNFINEIENGWIQAKLQTQQPERQRPHARDLTDEFKKAQALADELKNKPTVYDVVLKRESSPRNHITPSFYVGPGEVMPPEKRIPAVNLEEWDKVWGSQAPEASLKRKWAVRSEKWDQKTGSQDLRPFKKRKLEN